MAENKQRPNHGLSGRKILRVGYVPLTDCAPLVMAQELGLFRQYGLNVHLSRELGWTTIRDKILFGELDAAHAVAGLPFATTLGLGCAPCDCVTGLVLNLHGNAITVSNALARLVSNTGAGLRAFVAEQRGHRTLTFGIVSRYSSHHHLMRQWLAAAGVNPDTDVHLVVVPPPQMAVNLQAGHLDGFCVGEPWNSVAVELGAGHVAATSAELDPGHPEKVLMVRRDFAEKRETQHEALIAALIEACEYCADPAHHERVAATLAERQFVGVSASALRAGLGGAIHFGPTTERRVGDFLVFHDLHANEPSGDKAARVMQHLRACGLARDGMPFTPALAHKVFRSDIYERAVALRHRTQTPYEKESPETQLAPA
jgi:ABC-type nitrate/sulfonate/bicarbonate transport system substrate-binding protein